MQLLEKAPTPLLIECTERYIFTASWRSVCLSLEDPTWVHAELFQDFRACCTTSTMPDCQVGLPAKAVHAVHGSVISSSQSATVGLLKARPQNEAHVTAWIRGWAFARTSARSGKQQVEVRQPYEGLWRANVPRSESASGFECCLVCGNERQGRLLRCKGCSSAVLSVLFECPSPVSDISLGPDAVEILVGLIFGRVGRWLASVAS